MHYSPWEGDMDVYSPLGRWHQYDCWIGILHSFPPCTHRRMPKKSRAPLTNKERETLWWSQLVFRGKKNNSHNNTKWSDPLRSVCVHWLFQIEAKLLMCLLALMVTITSLQNTHQPQRVRWEVISTVTGEDLNMIEREIVPDA